MPKIIENIREKLLSEARRQINEHGYSAMTIRSVASGCGVGIGTVYNYFSSKDMLVASFMLEDWQECLRAVNTCRESSNTPEAVFRCIYDELQRYVRAHTVLFSDEGAVRSFASVFDERHAQLRGQIAELIQPVCIACASVPSDFLPEFLAESLLTWTVSGRSFNDIYSIISQLFSKGE